MNWFSHKTRSTLQVAAVSYVITQNAEYKANLGNSFLNLEGDELGR
jgi:hypothetical protein